MKKAITAILAVLLILTATLPVVAGNANAPAGSLASYTYDEWGKAVPCPAPYALSKSITGVDLGLGDFKRLNDIFTDSDGLVYVVSSGDKPEDNCIVKLDGDLNLLTVWTGYTTPDGQTVAFSEPLGIFITGAGEIYLADGSTREILHMDSECRLIRKILPPKAADSTIIDETFEEKYRPSKLVVDNYGQIHVVAANINQGIVEFDKDGKFDGFLAAGKVNANAVQLLWRKISTKEQRERMADFVPIEYNNITVDSENFLFASAAAVDNGVVLSEIRSGKGTEQGALVRRLNLMGKDILRRKGYTPPVGDVDILDTIANPDTAYQGISQITDIAAGENGSFLMLDNNRSKIFVYDSDGFLLYAFGGPDVTAGGFRTPVSMASSGGNVYVLDNGRRAIIHMRQTRFAKSVAAAMSFQLRGDYKESQAAWQDILNQNANYSLAYVWLGKAEYRAGAYKGAMKYFKTAGNKDWYSKAYKEHRKELIERWFVPVSGGAIALIVALFCLYLRRRKITRKRRSSP